MTLFRQIAIITTIGFLVLVFTVMWTNVRQSSHFLQGQLQTAAQDMATTLGITVANAAPDQNIAVIETFVNATFDSGYYSKIELVSIENELLFEKSRNISLGNVPDWFVNLVPLTSAIGSSQIIMGWLPYGTLKVTLHPGYVYSGLYTNLKTSAFWAIVVAFLGLSVLWVLLKFILKPLDMVLEQAEAIQLNEFIIQKKIPKTQELKQVVLAMNRMIEKVQTVFDDQTKMLQKYQNLKFKDEETGLSNRLHFLAKLENICKDELASGGVLVGIKIEGLNTVSEKDGHESAIKLVNSTSNIIQNHLKMHVWALLGRLKKAEFSIYLPGTKEDSQTTINAIFDDFKRNFLDKGSDEGLWLTAGAVTVNVGDKVNAVLSTMDMLVTKAGSQGRFCLEENDNVNTNLPIGKKAWRKWLLDSIEKKRFFVVGQPVFNIDMTEYHKEVFVRLLDESNNEISAGVFIPVATSLGIEFEIDKTVFSISKELNSVGHKLNLALNISDSVLSKPKSLEKFYQFIDDCSKTEIVLFIEISHIAFNRNIETVKEIAKKLNSVGFMLGVDHLDLNNSIESIKDIAPSYVKMNAKQLTNMNEDGASVGVQALLTLVNTLDVKLIAVGIDSEELHCKTMEIGVDGVQGVYYAGFEGIK